MKDFATLTMTGTRGMREQDHVYTSEDGRFTVIIKATDSGKKSDKNTLMSLWKKHGWVEEWLPTYLCVDTEYVDDEGMAWRRFDPTITMEHYEEGTIEHKVSPNGRTVIDFDWILEATPENEAKLIAECERMYRNGIKIH